MTIKFIPRAHCCSVINVEMADISMQHPVAASWYRYSALNLERIYISLYLPTYVLLLILTLKAFHSSGTLWTMAISTSDKFHLDWSPRYELIKQIELQFCTKLSYMINSPFSVQNVEGTKKQ